MPEKEEDECLLVILSHLFRKHFLVSFLFQGISGEALERAQFYLESAGWKLDLALSAFYADDDGDGDGDGAAPSAAEGQGNLLVPVPRFQSSVILL